MNAMSFLENKINLCYINVEDLGKGVEENHLLNQNFTREKEKGAKEINQQPNFFSDTELLLVYHDFLLLKVFTDNQATFLAKVYQLEYQNVCQKIFQAKKNIILVSERQGEMGSNVLSEGGKELKSNEKAIVLFKDKESIQKSLSEGLKEASVN